MPFHVYIVRCVDRSLYVGHTACVEQRVADHNAGRGALFTQIRRPVHLVYSEAFDNEVDAIARERQIKRWSRAKKEALVAGDLQGLRAAARRKH